MGATPAETMFRIVMTEPDGNFVQADKNLIRCPHLTASQKETWLMIASTCWHGESSKLICSWTDVAKENGIQYKKFMDAKKSLHRAGGLITNEDGDWELVIPNQEKLPTINDEVEDQPKRKHTMTQKEAWELIKEGWNKDKPEAWMRLDGSFNLPVYIAFETQAKRLNVEREDYARFAAQVCRGATADPWWSKQAMKASSVFGFSKVTDKKFENVEKLYKAGAAVESKIDYACDADILARYHEKGRTDLVKVIRLEAEDSFQATEHLNTIPDEEYDPTAAYIYLAPGSERPIHWSGRTTNSTRYLFS
jgi:hypothetical protein